VNILALLMIENIVRNSSEDSRSVVQLIGFGIGLFLAYDVFYYVSVLTKESVDFRFVIARGYVTALSAPFLLFAMARATVWRGGFGVSRHVVFHSTALIGAGVYLLVVSIAGDVLRLNSGNWGPAFEVAFLVVAVVIMLVVLQSGAVRAGLMVFISKHFFRLKYDYREVWLKFIQRMSGQKGAGNLHERTLSAVMDAIGCSSAALWTLQAYVEAYSPSASANFGQDLPLEPIGSTLPEYLAATGWVIDIQQCITDASFYGDLVLPQWLIQQKKAWVVMPLLHRGVLEGFMVLGSPATPTTLRWEELDLMKTVGAQAASYLAEERALVELADARRMAEFNRRFAFVLHDIKNVVAQMSLILQNVEQHGSDPDFQRDMMVTVASSVDRMRRMLVQLGSGTQSRRREFAEVDVRTLVEDAANRWKHSAAAFEIRMEAEPVMVTASSERLASVLDHLIQNGLEAMGPGGKMQIVVSATTKEGIVEIRDHGPGMAPEFVRDRLFRPLDTSKPTGTGIGAFQALRHVRDMGGELEVDSHVGKGTLMRIRLPRAVPLAANEGSLKDADEASA
jgi:putative PEP-CTERM system histidine kinase